MVDVVIDKFEAAKNTLTGDNLNKAVCKASSHEIIAPKRKHVDYLVLSTNEPTVSMPDLATFILERVKVANWVVSFKALITAHFLMVQGNERFLQYLAPRTSNFLAENLSDKSTVEAMNMATFVRKYARYLNIKALTYQRAGFDYCRVKRGENGFFRTMTINKLMSYLPILQEQFDALLYFDPRAHEVCNSVIFAAFVRCFQDLIKLYALYNEGIIVMLEHFFDFKRTLAKEGIEVYKKYLIRCENAKNFFSVASEVGVEDQNVIDVSHSGSDLLQAMETHLNELEGKVSPQGSALSIGSKSPSSTEPPKKHVSFSPAKRIFSPQPQKATLDVAKPIATAASDEAIYAKPKKSHSELNELQDIFGAPNPASDPWNAQKRDPVPFSGNPFPPTGAFEPSSFASGPILSNFSEPTLFDTILEPEKLNQPLAPAEEKKQKLGVDVSTGLERTLVDLNLGTGKKLTSDHVWQEKEVRLTGGDAYAKLPTQMSTTQVNTQQPQQQQHQQGGWSGATQFGNPNGHNHNSIF